MSEKAKKIKERYRKGFVTDVQLLKYLDIGAITQSEYNEILNSN